MFSNFYTLLLFSGSYSVIILFSVICIIGPVTLNPFDGNIYILNDRGEQFSVFLYIPHLRGMHLCLVNISQIFLRTESIFDYDGELMCVYAWEKAFFERQITFGDMTFYVWETIRFGGIFFTAARITLFLLFLYGFSSVYYCSYHYMSS